MDFKKKRITRESPTKKLLDPEKAKFITIVSGLAIVGFLLVSIFMLVKSLDFSAIIFSFGRNLRVDSFGHTNILLTGVGGEGHDGADLTDTIIVASIDYDNKLVTMLSIPRDLYIKSKKLTTGDRINQIYFIGKHKYNSQAGLEELKQIVSGITNIPVDYYIKVDFGGFKKIVDSLGGIDVMVEKDIYDPYYPLGETIKYDTFSINAGPQHLDGETALKYARSRKTTSDFDRAQRQQQILGALKEKAFSLNILTDPGKIQALYQSLSSSIETDLSVNEIISLAKTAKEFNKESIIPHVLTDNPEECGGFLYTPAREFFGGASVLLPAGGNYEPIQSMSQYIFNYPKIIEEQSPIQILNATKTPNIAGDVTYNLNRLCFNILYYGNAKDRNMESSTIYYLPGPNGEKPATLDLLTKLLPFKIKEGLPVEYINNEKKQATKIIVELGADYLQRKLKNPFANLTYLAAPVTTNSTQQTTQQNTQ